MKNKRGSAEETRLAFIDALCLLHIEKPLEKITVQEVARKAGYHRSTFYQYFLDIEDLLLSMEEEIIKELKEKNLIKKVIDTLLIEDLARRLEENELYLRTLFSDYSNNRFLERIKSMAEEEIAELNLGIDDKLTSYLLEYHLSGVFSLFRLWLRKDQDLSTEEFVSFVAGLYEKVIFSGHKGSLRPQIKG